MGYLKIYRQYQQLRMRTFVSHMGAPFRPLDMMYERIVIQNIFEMTEKRTLKFTNTQQHLAPLCKMTTVQLRCWMDTTHYNDVIIGAIASQITSLTIVCSIIYSDADQRKHKSSRHWPLCGEFTGDRWIPRTNGQLRGKCFHLMTSSCTVRTRTRINKLSKKDCV